MLMDERININTVNKYKQTAFQYACKKGLCTIETIKLFMDHPQIDAKYLNIQDVKGNTVFHFVCERNDVDLLNLFLSDGRIDFNKRDYHGYTPYGRAVSYGCESVIEILKRDGRIIQ